MQSKNIVKMLDFFLVTRLKSNKNKNRERKNKARSLSSRKRGSYGISKDVGLLKAICFFVSKTENEHCSLP
jgi:hypothetical protein